ncbi:MAG: sugar phosphate isomerase/epimerase [Clostridia bacterium]|nr:sugar phosphate isomerase/epimerase [Clostridia bacterium]
MKYELGIYDLTNCSSLNFKDRILIYKNAGFKELGLYLDEKYMQYNENYVDIINFARQQGLSIKQVHIDYKISNLICDKTTDEYFKYIDQKANECKLLKVNFMVLHASKGDNPPRITKDQLEKLKNTTKKYPEVIFCFENVRNNSNLNDILSLNLPNIKMCYDLGHAHAYGDETDIFERFNNFIVCSHLHNNFGKDDHNVLQNGEINYNPILAKLTKIDGASNCVEAFPKSEKLLSKQQFKKFVNDCANF